MIEKAMEELGKSWDLQRMYMRGAIRRVVDKLRECLDLDAGVTGIGDDLTMKAARALREAQEMLDVLQHVRGIMAGLRQAWRRLDDDKSYEAEYGAAEKNLRQAWRILSGAEPEPEPEPETGRDPEEDGDG
jgi:hypothetical protein